MQIKFSIPTKVFLGFAIVILAFLSSASYSIYRHHITANLIRLISQGYLKLSFIIAEVRGTQMIFNTLLDRLSEEQNPAVSLDWLQTVQKVRPSRFKRIIKVIKKSYELPLSSEDIRFLNMLLRKIHGLNRYLLESKEGFSELFSSIGIGDQVRARLILEQIKQNEFYIEEILWLLENKLTNKITELTEEAQRDEGYVLLTILVLVSLALMISLFVMIAILWTMKPLGYLKDGVASVAKGDFTRRVRIHSKDELGALARDFNFMISALEEREKRLIRSERLAAIGQMAAHITHEVRNPLSSLGLNTELLEEELNILDPHHNSEARTLLTAIKKEIGRLSEITKEYLSFVHLPPPSKKLENINELLQEVTEFMKPELTKYGIKIQWKLEKEPLMVKLDEVQIKQALFNLIKNAYESMKNGGVLEISSSRKDQGVQITISDTGQGIKEEDLPKIFDPFFTTKQQGTGLGLTLTYQIITTHKGTLKCKSKANEGTIFFIYLPEGEGINER
jgi:signal transduction histidine kinase